MKMQPLKFVATVAVCLFAVSGVAAPISESEEWKVWPINEKTKLIPKHIDERTGFISPDVEKAIDRANAKYEPDERQQIIDFCRHEAFKRVTGNLSKNTVSKRLKDRSDALLGSLQEEFQYCAVGMIRSWEADDAKAEKEQVR